MMANATVDAAGVPGYAITHLHEIAVEVFSTMVRCPLTERPDGATRIHPRDIAGTVAFSGSWTGYVSMVTSQRGARHITAALLEMAPTQVDDQVHDAFGEVVNMVTGSFRTRMVKPGDAWAITMPVVATGHDLAIEPPGDVSHVVRSYLMDTEVVDIHLVVTSLGR
jgi:chemotaxis protein CheX